LEATGDVKIIGKTVHQGTIEMGGAAISLGGSGATATAIRHANNRIEFLVGGTVRFYIDNTGGHNAWSRIECYKTKPPP